MLQIKTIVKNFNQHQEFDSEVNAALQEGWKLRKRSGHGILYAELEKGREYSYPASAWDSEFGAAEANRFK